MLREEKEEGVEMTLFCKKALSWGAGAEVGRQARRWTLAALQRGSLKPGEHGP